MTTIIVVHGGETLLEVNEKNALAPLEEGERALVFQALTGALALLAGVTLPASGATATGMDAHCASTERCPEDRTTGNVVRLATRRGSPT